MPVSTYFHLVGYTFGLAGFASLYWAARASLIARGRDLHMKALLPVHFLRYFGLTALLPGVFDLAPAGFTEDYLFQIVFGDVLVAALALIAFWLFQTGSRLRFGFAWLFNIVGTLDYLNAAARVTPAIHDANILGPLGWLVITVLLPAWLVSHVAIFFVLVSSEDAK